jgi:CRP-like cAMP-binding protein
MLADNGRARNPLVTKLSQFVPLSAADVGVLEGLCASEERFGAGANIFDEGDAPRAAFVVTRGMACRYRLLQDGRRQILTFLMPGDFCDLHAYLLRAMDHSVGAIVPTRIAIVERDIVSEIVAHHPRLSAALSWSAMQEGAMLRERIVALGRRDARGRVAYLLCELVWRQRAVRMAEDHAIRLPLTQTDLADTLGLTAVHVNRVLQRFRQDQLIRLGQRRLTLLDVEKLQAMAGLTSNYLQIGSTPPEVLGYLDRLESDRGSQ